MILLVHLFIYLFIYYLLVCLVLIYFNRNTSIGIEKEKKGEKHAIAFRTKTQLETLDDGYKWRKYGKKKVKTNINLR